MHRRAMLAALLVLSCAAPTSRLSHARSGWSVEGSTLSIADAENGQPMPAGWTLDNYFERDGVLQKRAGTGALFVFQRGQTRIVLTAEPLHAEDGEASVATLARKSMGSFGTSVVNRPPMQGGPGLDPRYEQYDAFTGKRVESVPPGHSLIERRFRSIEPPAPAAVQGADAIQATFDQLDPAGGRSLARFYAVWIRPQARAELVMLVYSALPGSFDDGLADTRDLLRRLRVSP